MLSIFSLTSKSTHQSRSRTTFVFVLKKKYELKIVSIDSPCKFRVLLEMIVPSFGVLDFCFLHRSFFHTSDGIWESVNFCSVHFRQFSVEKTICLTTLLFSLHLTWNRQLMERNFPPLSGDKTSGTRRLLLSSDHWKSLLFICSKIKWPSIAQPDFHTFDAYWLPNWSTFWYVSSPEASLGSFLKLCKRKVSEKNCGHHLIYNVVWFSQIQLWLPLDCGE